MKKKKLFIIPLGMLIQCYQNKKNIFKYIAKVVIYSLILFDRIFFLDKLSKRKFVGSVIFYCSASPKYKDIGGFLLGNVSA